MRYTPLCVFTCFYRNPSFCGRLPCQDLFSLFSPDELCLFTFISALRVCHNFITPANKTILLFISAAVILVLAPIRHKNHPLSEQTYRKNAAIGRTITILISMITVWLLLNNIAAAVTTMIVVTLMAIAIMMIIPKIQKE